MLERKVMNAHDYGTRDHRRRCELNVQNVNRTLPERSAQGYRYPNQGTVRKRSDDGKIWPAAFEAFHRLSLGYIEGIAIGLIDLRKRFDEVDGVGFVAGESGAN